MKFSRILYHGRLAPAGTGKMPVLQYHFASRRMMFGPLLASTDNPASFNSGAFEIVIPRSEKINTFSNVTSLIGELGRPAMVPPVGQLLAVKLRMVMLRTCGVPIS